MSAADLLPVAGRAGMGWPSHWTDLRDGRLFERPVFGDLRRAFEEWRKGVTARTGDVPAVFCICGRGGEGKSVLLAQLAAALLGENTVAELHFYEPGDDARFFETPPSEERVWHFADRLPGSAHGANGEDWLRRLRERQPCFVVTTASSSALDLFAKRHPRKFALTLWHLPPLSATEAASLASACGNEANAKLWHQGVTVEEFLFACKHGAPLEQLNDKLLCLLEPLAIGPLPMVWAANALGMPAPVSLLKEEHRGSARRLDGLPIQCSGGGLRLVAPRLAGPLFRHWFPDADSRQDRLAEGFADFLEIWLRHNDARPASDFLHGLLHSEHLSNVLPPIRPHNAARAWRKQLMRELYRAHCSRHNGRPALALLAAWMEIGQTFRLRPDVMEDAAGMLAEAPGSFSPEQVADIWLNGDRRRNPLAAKIQQAVANYFQQSKADTGAALARLYRATKHQQQALPLLQRWLDTHALHPCFEAVFSAVLEGHYGSSLVWDWAKQNLGRNWRGRAAGKPLALLLQRRSDSEAICEVARRWLPQHKGVLEAGPVLKELLRDAKDNVPAIHAALLWTAQFPAQPVATELWELLLQRHSARREVRDVALEWLRAFPDHPRAADVMIEFARRLRGHADFAALARQWVQAHAQHEKIPLLLEAMAPSRNEAVRLTLGQWLDQHPQHPLAVRVLAAVLFAGPVSSEWRRRAQTFLHSGHADAQRILRVLLCDPADESVVELVLGFLSKSESPAQRRLARWLGELAGRQPEQAARLLASWPDQPELREEFSDALREKLRAMRMVRLAIWVKEGLAKMSDSDQQWMFGRLLERDSPLPPPLSQALAHWLQRNLKQPAFRQMAQTLRQYPNQGRYFHSASMLPLDILADILAR